MSLCPTILLAASLATAAEAAGPTLDHLFPAGAPRGGTVEVRLAGRFDRWPVRIWVDEPGVTFEAAPEKGKLIARVDPQAVPGPRLVRLADDQGASAPRPFLVGALPERLEQEPNDEPGKATAIESVPIVVNGRLGQRGDVDAFAVSLKKGQTLVASVEANRRLGSPMDAVIQVASLDGIVRQQADDTPGLDPTTAFEAPADGRYLVRIFAFPEKPDSSIAFAGGASLIYRLTLTTSGLLENVLPLVCPPADKPEFEAIGWNLPPELGPLHADATDGRVRVWHPRLAGDVVVRIVQQPGRKEGTRGPWIPPVCVSGRIASPEEEDRYRFVLKKGRSYRFHVQARSLGSPLDPVLKVRDGAGKVVAERDDSSGRDTEVVLKAAGEGVFEAAVSDLTGQGGGRHVYLLSVGEPAPDFALEAADDRLILVPGKTAALSVKVLRRDGFDRPIVLESAGLPAGVSLRAETSQPKGASAAGVKLTFEASPGARAYSGPFEVRGRSGEFVRPVFWHVPGIEGAQVTRLWLTVPPSAK